MKWITRESVKVDRMAMPVAHQAIRRSRCSTRIFAEIYGLVFGMDGILLDVPGCELGHHGEDVSFNSILKRHSLNDPSLRLLAKIVRAADSHQTNPHVAGEGLRWIAQGFSKLLLSDHELLNRDFILYDALNAKCKERSVTHESKVKEYQ